MNDLATDLRQSVRRLIGRPGFTAVVLSTLALGIGANTAIFSLVNTILLKPFPYHAPDRLVTVEHYYPSLNKMLAPVSAPGFVDYRQRTDLFSSVAIEAGWNANLTGSGEPERLAGSQVSGLYFSTLGVDAALGRTIRPGEDEAGRHHVAVISDGLWRRHFGAEPGILGRTLVINGERYEVVGVMPKGFRDFWSRTIEVWAPLVLAPEEFADNHRTWESYALTARLRDDVSAGSAQVRLTALAEQLKKQYPDNYPPDWTLTVTPLADKATGSVRPALLVLLGAVGFVLLIACANVANLYLARSAAGQKEVAIRTALGASRGRIVRQVLTETLLVSVVGAGLGVLLASFGVQALVALDLDSLPRVDELGIDWRVLVFSTLVGMATGVLFGLVPAIRVSRADVHETLKEGGRGTSDTSGLALRRALVVAEVGLALTLLVGAGLLIKSFARLQDVAPGFDSSNLLTLTLSLPESKYATAAQQIAFYDRVLERVATVPGVAAVGAISNLPFGGTWWTGGFQVEGYQQPPGQPGPHGDLRTVSANYFKALRIPLIKGRVFTNQDGPDTMKIAVVDELFAKRYWSGLDPIGRRINYDGTPERPNWRQVVGVVGHTKHEALNAEPRVQLFIPFRQLGSREMSLALRSETRDPLSLVSSVVPAIHEIDRDQPVDRIRTMDALVTRSMDERRLSTWLLGLFAATALVLASIGIYGVMAYSVAQRTRELGIRMALGAERHRVLRMVMGQGMLLAVIGTVLGLIGAYVLTAAIESQLYGVRSTDLTTFSLVSVLLLVTAALANCLPALRATRIDPVVALRNE